MAKLKSKKILSEELSKPKYEDVKEMVIEHKKILTAFILNNLRILKAKNPGDTYYDEYLKHTARDRKSVV